MVSMGEYLTANELSSVPMLEHDFYFLRPEDYQTWRAYARQLALDTPIKREDARQVALLIDKYPDPNLDMMYGQRDFDALKGYVPKIESMTAMAEEHKLGIGAYIRVKALTSAQYSKAIRMSGTEGNSDWYVIAYGLVEPSILDSYDDDAIKEAAAKVSEWSIVNVRLIAQKIGRLTVHPGDVRKKNESDAFTDFFGLDG